MRIHPDRDDAIVWADEIWKRKEAWGIDRICHALDDFGEFMACASPDPKVYDEKYITAVRNRLIYLAHVEVEENPEKYSGTG